jgi:hypothetical protein
MLDLRQSLVKRYLPSLLWCSEIQISRTALLFTLLPQQIKTVIPFLGRSIERSYYIIGWRIWLKHCATSREVAGSIPDWFIAIFHWFNPSCYTMAPELTQPLAEMRTRTGSLWVKAVGAQGWHPCYFPMPIIWKSGNFKLLEPSEAFPGLYRDSVTFTL